MTDGLTLPELAQVIGAPEPILRWIVDTANVQPVGVRRTGAPGKPARVYDPLEVGAAYERVMAALIPQPRHAADSPCPGELRQAN